MQALSVLTFQSLVVSKVEFSSSPGILGYRNALISKKCLMQTLKGDFVRIYAQQTRSGHIQFFNEAIIECKLNVLVANIEGGGN